MYAKGEINFMTREDDQNFLKIFHNNLVGMILTNDQYIIVDINDHLLLIIEMQRKDVIGKTALELGIINEQFIKDTWPQLVGAEKISNVEISFTTKNNTKGICLFSTEKITLGGKVYWLSAIIDIRERKKTEEKLTEIYERVTDGFIAIDNNWCYTYVNKKAAELLGKDPAYLIGKHIWTEFPQEVDDPFYLAYLKAMEKQEMIMVEEYVESYDRWFQNLIYPSPDGLSVFFTDITAKKKSRTKDRRQ